MPFCLEITIIDKGQEEEIYNQIADKRGNRYRDKENYLHFFRRFRNLGTMNEWIDKVKHLPVRFS